MTRLSVSDHGPSAAHDPSLSDAQALRQPWVPLDTRPINSVYSSVSICILKGNTIHDPPCGATFLISLRTTSAFSKCPSSPRAFAFRKSALELAGFLLRACKTEHAKVVLRRLTNLVSGVHCSLPVFLFYMAGGHVCIYFLEYHICLSITKHTGHFIFDALSSKSYLSQFFLRTGSLVHC
jgi:hypothetical protein